MVAPFSSVQTTASVAIWRPIKVIASRLNTRPCPVGTLLHCLVAGRNSMANMSRHMKQSVYRPRWMVLALVTLAIQPCTKIRRSKGTPSTGMGLVITIATAQVSNQSILLYCNNIFCADGSLPQHGWRSHCTPDAFKCPGTFTSCSFSGLVCVLMHDRFSDGKVVHRDSENYCRFALCDHRQ